MKYIIANWKANKTIPEAKKWLQELLNGYMAKWSGKVIIGAPFTVLAPLKEQLAIQPSNHSSISLAAQDVSPFPSGAYTGEVTAEMLKGLVDYVIVGHSERRRYFGETDEVVAKKVKQALENDIRPIVCLDEPYIASQIKSINDQQLIINNQFIFAYEPVEAIGSGKPETPEKANQVAKRIKDLVKYEVPVIYGGSVNSKNVKIFVDQENVDGVLIGSASLDAVEFGKITKAVQEK